MKSFISLLIFLLLWQNMYAQKAPSHQEVNVYAAIDSKALAMPDASTASTSSIADYINANFRTEQDKARAIFIWLATFIAYDVDNMYAINFYEQKDEKINKALKTRKGICENYAAIFNDVCLKMGIKSFVIEGYTSQNGTASYLPHAWCAAMVDSKWYLFDPTWGSGYISNNKFTRKINNSFFKMMPEEIVKTHMPFDPMWEFLNYPVTNAEFYEGKIQVNKSKPYFSYADSIAVWEKQDELQQLTSSSRRVEQNGVKNALVYDRLEHLKRQKEYLKNSRAVASQNAVIDNYNSANAHYNEAVNAFNTFITYRNNQFKPLKSDPEIQAMVDSIDIPLIAAKQLMKSVTSNNSLSASMLATANKSMTELSGRLDEQKEFLKKYFSKGKLGRKTMFTKYTWMGIPLN